MRYRIMPVIQLIEADHRSYENILNYVLFGALHPNLPRQRQLLLRLTQPNVLVRVPAFSRATLIQYHFRKNRFGLEIYNRKPQSLKN